jgi:membrane fusion protein (multidrug efflux system)
MVKAGERVGNLWIIDSGLKPGEKVIVEGLQKVKPGVQVSAKLEKVKETASPTGSAPASASEPKEAKGK